MIITRAPLRISISGGGTDLPSYYGKYGGITTSLAIDKYVYCIITKIPRQEYRLRFVGGAGQNESSAYLYAIHDKYMKAVLSKYDVGPGISITVMSQVPAGTGLGSSGSFLVALIKAVLAYKGTYIGESELAEAAFDIEANALKGPVGKQDQYTSAIGGYCSLVYNPDGTVKVSTINKFPLIMSEELGNLRLYYTKVSRNSSVVLQDQVDKSDSKEVINNLHKIKALALKALPLPEHLQKHWAIKKERSSNISSDTFDQIYYTAMKNGAQGGKLVGAGGGGFFLFYTTAPSHLDAAMKLMGLVHMPFRPSPFGAELLENTDEYPELYR